MSDQKILNYKSCFDIIGPVMVGPSSSHTAGAIAIGAAARKLLQWEPTKATVLYYESFAETHRGHGTDYAIASGILGFATDDTRVPEAVAIAAEKGIDITFVECPEDSPCGHANTADVTLHDGFATVRVLGISVGGGMIEVKQFEIEGFTDTPEGPLPILIFLNDANDDAVLQRFLQEQGVPIRVSRHQERAGRHFFVYELQTVVPLAVQEALFALGVQHQHKIILL